MSEAWDIASGAGVTALGLAAARTVESGRGDRLIDDPYARGLFLAAGASLPMRLDWPATGEAVSDAEALHLHGSRYIGLRTRVYDDALLAGAGAGASQAVILGAGLDTRAFRLELPAVFTVFELDQPKILRFKAAALAGQGAQPRCRHVALGVDLREDWPARLRGHGFVPELATAWIAEGVLPYLPPDAQLVLIDRIRTLSAPGSTLAFDRIAGDPTTGGRLEELSARSGIEMDRLLACGAGPDLAGVLRRGGWTVHEQPARALAERYGRDLDDPFAGDHDRASEPPWLDTVFTTANLNS